MLVSAVRAAGGDADDQQVECMLANLIHQGCFLGLYLFVYVFCFVVYIYSFVYYVLFIYIYLFMYYVFSPRLCIMFFPLANFITKVISMART